MEADSLRKLSVDLHADVVESATLVRRSESVARARIGVVFRPPRATMERNFKGMPSWPARA